MNKEKKNIVTVWPDNRVKIKSIHIRNFRSIKSKTLYVSDLNIFVGLNDVGKSNFLKALNLFFNGYTDYDTPFAFNRDFTYLYSKNSHNTKEIVVEIKFNVPTTFKDSGVYIWKKIWRNEGLFLDEIKRENGDKPAPRSRIPGTLKKIRFRYIPAVKSKQYYKELLGELYITISSVINSPLQGAIDQFTGVLQNYTMSIHDEVQKQLNIDSQISLPENLTDIFKAMIFQTHYCETEKMIPLDMRGDGVQARHIPIILRYIEEQDRRTSSKGGLSVFTIWGYEEPENGVELSKAFEMADSFHEYAKSIQIFVTSHSPAFYTQKTKENTDVFYVTNDGFKTEASERFDVSEISSTMGLMPLVAPYIKEKVCELEKIKNSILNDSFSDINTIAVEGITDRDYLVEAIKLYSDKLNKMMKNNELRVFTKEGEGGCSALVDYSVAWGYTKNKNKLVVLLDKDFAGIDTHKKINENKKENSKVSTMYLEPTDVIKENIYIKKFTIPYEIEHLLSIDCWNVISSKKWIEPRKPDELIEILKEHFTADKALKDTIMSAFDDKDLINTIILNNPKSDKKTDICNWVLKCSDELKREYLSGLENTIKKLEDKFT